VPGVSMQSIAEANNAKLRKRFPQRFTEHHAVARADKTTVDGSPLR
jgi:hypothetical protein